MTTYTLYAELGKYFVRVKRGRHEPERMHLAGSRMPLNSAFRFRGNHLEHLAITILADHFGVSDEAALRGKTQAWKLHREFSVEIMEPYMVPSANYPVIASCDIERWIKLRTRKHVEASLFTEENTWQKSA